MDGAALQHEALGAVGVHVRHLTDLLRYLIVPVPREVQAVVQAAPCVEGPVHRPQAALTVYQKVGPQSRTHASLEDTSTTRISSGRRARAF